MERHNRHKKKGVVFVALVLTALIGGVLSSSLTTTLRGAQAENKPTITVTDMVGREVTLPYPVNRIVLTIRGQADKIKILRAEEKVVGIERSVGLQGYYRGISDKPIVGHQHLGGGLNYEKIAELKAEVVLLYCEHPLSPTAPTIEQLYKIGVKTLCVDAFTPEQHVKSIQLLGKILGKEKRVEEYLRWRENNTIEVLKTSLRGLDDKEKQKALLRDTGIRGTLGKGLPLNRTLEIAGLINVFDFVRKDVEPESVIEKNPSIILFGDWEDKFVGYNTATCSESQRVIQAELEKRTEFKNTAAGKNNQVYMINYTLLTGTMGDIGALYLAKMAYPERFKNIDPVAVHKEYFEKWLGVAYQGMWFCPQPRR